MTAGDLALIRPGWRLPGVGAAMSLRPGGVSTGPWAELNLGTAVGDDPAGVTENRRRFAAALQARPVWLRQVHGTNVLRLVASTPAHPDEAADAAWTTERGIACVVQLADCLPVLLAEANGGAVAAVHAGWRGLASGVVEAALAAMAAGTRARPADLYAWLGPCIGRRSFEVGADVLVAFGVEPAERTLQRFTYQPRPDGTRRWLADLQGLAADRLRAAGVSVIDVADECTFELSSRFFSFRRDGRTGRMAAAIWRQ
jgi:YfiH family protein